MHLLTYLLFFVTALFYVGIALLTLSSADAGGANSMGYGLLLVFLEIGFTMSGLILIALIRSTGGFDWITQETGIRTMLVFGFWLSVALTSFFGSLFKIEWHPEGAYPQFLRWLAVGYCQLWVPLLWLVACFLSLNPGWQSTLSLQTFRIPFWVGLSVSALFSGGLLVGYVRDSAQRAKVEAATRIDDAKRWHQQYLADIAAHKPEDSILGILTFSTRFQDDDVRQAALAKIKSHPDWEAQLLKLLANKYYYKEVYSFLGSNRVDHPTAFVQPLNQSITQLSADVKTYIESGENLQSWSFDSYGIDHLLKAIDDQFSGQIALFYPSVVKLRQALNTPPSERDKNVRLTVTGGVDTWLKTHKK